MTLTALADGVTQISGAVQDQVALQGILLKLHDLGLVLISVQSVEKPAPLPNFR
jgi:hypothetical protein